VLRDEQGIIRLAFVTRGDVPYRARATRRGRWQRPGELTPAELLRLLVRDNYRSPETEGGRPAMERMLDVAARFRSPNPRPPAPPLRGDRRVAGLPAAPGRAAGFVRIGGPHRHPSEFDGAVLVAPTVEPADAPCLVRAVAAVSTGGGSLSHVGLLALELGKPSLIVAGEWRRAADGQDVLVLRRTEQRQRTRRVRSLAVSCWERVREHEDEVREGDLVVVDADDGTLRLLGADRDALVLHQGLRDLEASTRAVVAAADDAALLAARGDLLRVMHQLDRTVARMGQPVLAHYAVRELIAAQAAPGAGAGTRERRQLLEALCRHPLHGEAACTARTGALDALVRRLRGLTAAARSTIPSLEGPLEVLFVRASAARLRDGLLGIAAMYPPGDPAARGPRHAARAAAALDPHAVDRLAVLRATLLREVRSPTDARGPYALRAIDCIDRVLPPSDTARVRGLLDRTRASVAAAEDAARRRLANRRVIAADEAAPGLEPWLGRKATMLAEVARVLSPGAVPPWFAVTDRAFQDALRTLTPARGHGVAVPLEVAIQAVLARADVEPARKSARIRQLWLDTPLPAALDGEVADAYRTLADLCGDMDPFVAIRSSALEEDSPSGTWAGQFDTFLFVAGLESLRRHLQLAWAGLWSTRALYHRGPASARDAAPGGGILVQRMVDARVSGVVVTADPVAGEMRELVVNAGLGLGEGVVSGKVDADEIHVARNENPGEPLRLRYRVADKRERTVFDVARGSGTRRVETLFHQRLRPALEYTELEALVDTAVSLDRAFGEPLDVEFSLEGSKLWILQARPIPLFRAALTETIERFPLKELRG
jgi:phosphohistidine swiveling domain-containing protein